LSLGSTGPWLAQMLLFPLTHTSFGNETTPPYRHASGDMSPLPTVTSFNPYPPLTSCLKDSNPIMNNKALSCKSIYF
jgi:hypothetical protein